MKIQHSRIIQIIRIFLYVSVTILTILSTYINLPFFYQPDDPQPFGFYSDNFSTQIHLKYDSCTLESLNNSLSDSVDIRFGCYSSQFPPISPPGTFLNYHGNCKHTAQFDTSLLDNQIPDYFIKFPFNLNYIGRSCRGLVNITAHNDQNVILGDIFASSLGDRSNTLIVQWDVIPSPAEFRTSSSRFYRQISYDKISINYYISDEWAIKVNNTGNLNQDLMYNNRPNRFDIILLIPKNYTIENLENYNPSDETRGFEYLQNFWTITIDLTQKPLHMIIIDPSKEFVKSAVNWLMTGFGILFIGDILIRKLNKDKISENKN